MVNGFCLYAKAFEKKKKICICMVIIVVVMVEALKGSAKVLYWCMILKPDEINQTGEDLAKQKFLLENCMSLIFETFCVSSIFLNMFRIGLLVCKTYYREVLHKMSMTAIRFSCLLTRVNKTYEERKLLNSHWK
jgi:hypothetical protein